MKVLSLVHPYDGGVWQSGRRLLNSLNEAGAEVQWCGAGRAAAKDCKRYASTTDLESGCVVSPEVHEPRLIAKALFDRVVESEVDCVILHGLSGQIESSLAHYLPIRIRRLIIVHSITPATYRAVKAVSNVVHGVCAISERISDDLSKHYGIDPSLIHVIPNVIPSQYFNPGRLPVDGCVRPLRIVVLGRIENESKGVYAIPSIFRRLLQSKIDFRLTIAGDGPDREELVRRIAAAGLAERTQFLGEIGHEVVPECLRGHDVFLFPSHFEGFGNALIEAMGCGCAPVASRIEGVTTDMITEGKTGFLFPIGDCEAAARILIDLAKNRRLLNEVQRSAGDAAMRLFHPSVTQARYMEVIASILSSPRPIGPIQPIEEWKLPRLLGPAWWHSMPDWMKHAGRLAYERLH
jgi:glycosyltransferase involved in cell wall biosynthesis